MIKNTRLKVVDLGKIKKKVDYSASKGLLISVFELKSMWSK